MDLDTPVYGYTNTHVNGESLAELERRLRELESRPWHRRFGYRTNRGAVLIAGALAYSLIAGDSWSAVVVPGLLATSAALDLWIWSVERKAARLAVAEARRALSTRRDDA